MSTDQLAYTQAEAAACLSISRTWFRKQVLPQLKVVRLGRRTLIPRAEIERWLDTEAQGL